MDKQGRVLEKINNILIHIDPLYMTDIEYEIYALLNKDVPKKIPYQCKINSEKIIND